MKITQQAADAFPLAWDETRDGPREKGWNRLQQVIDDYTDSVRAAKETAMDERTPKAKQLVAMMKATMNLDLDELIQAGVIDDRDGQESSPWAKWNKDAPLFIAKLDDRQLNSLAALIAHKFPDAFAARSPDYRALLEKAVEALEAWHNIAEHCTISDGMCCCGDDMERHPELMSCNHSPVDHGAYNADLTLKRTAATLTTIKTALEPK